jgi:hypothetical protein
MEMTLDEVELYKPYRFSWLDEGFIIFLDRVRDNNLVVEHNPKINSVSIHRWRPTAGMGKHMKRMFDLKDFKDYHYVVKKFFDVASFFVDGDKI